MEKKVLFRWGKTFFIYRHEALFLCAVSYAKGKIAILDRNCGCGHHRTGHAIIHLTFKR